MFKMALLLNSKQLTQLMEGLVTEGSNAQLIWHQSWFNLKVNPSSQEVYVNKWPDPTVVLLKHVPSQCLKLQALMNFVYVKERKDWRTFLEQNVIDWSDTSNCWMFLGRFSSFMHSYQDY